MAQHSEAGTNRTGGHIEGLDGLRGLAALAVFGVHYNQIADIDLSAGPIDTYLLFSNGKYGVALFFILSGFLLSIPFWNAINRQSAWPDIRTYFVRRLARIVPAYYLCLTILILVSGYWKFPEAWSDILLHYTFLFNYAEFSFFSINAPFWTLAVEIQFYCLLPFLFITLRGLKPTHRLIALFLSGVVIYGLHATIVSHFDKTVSWPASSSLTWIRPYGAVLTHSLLAHLPLFYLGIFTAGVIQYLPTAKPQPAMKFSLFYDAVFWSSLFLLLLLLSTEINSWFHIPYGRYGLPLLPLLLAALVLTTPPSHFARQLLESRPLSRLGSISYGIYIYHLPVLTHVDQAMTGMAMDPREHPLYLGLFSLSVTLVAAVLSYLLVEKPVLALAHRRNVRR